MPGSGASVLVLLLAAALAGSIQACRPARPVSPRPPESEEKARSMNEAAQRYVRLVLAVGQHDPDYVDAYYGPPEWKKEAGAARRPLAGIRTEAASLVASIRALPGQAEDEMSLLRRRYLERQLEALISRVDMLGGKRLTFDEESRALYDAVAPTLPEEHFERLASDLGRILPGSGPLTERYDAFRKQFEIPRPRLDSVFEAAIAACRDRTRTHIPLPAEESFRVEYVTGKSWSGYNWYQGEFRSLIQVNTDFPISIDRAVDLACHEGYPGHHVYNVLLEKSLVRDRGWVEFSVYPLFSPQSLIAEGSANFGIEVAFPGRERIEFEKATLFPLAGLDAARAEEFARIRTIVDRLSYAGNEAARRYLNGEIDASRAVEWLTLYALMPADRAGQRVRFFDQYRSYVINYNLGKDLVRAFIERRTRNDAAPTRKWREFAALLSSPRLPSTLK